MHISQYHPFRVVLNTLTCKVTHATRVTRLLLFSLTKSAQKSVWVQVVQIRNYVCFLKTEGTKAKRHESGVCIVLLAEEVRFELTVGSHPRQFSRL
jgi:hypothetical protein